MVFIAYCSKLTFVYFAFGLADRP